VQNKIENLMNGWRIENKNLNIIRGSKKKQKKDNIIKGSPEKRLKIAVEKMIRNELKIDAMVKETKRETNMITAKLKNMEQKKK